MISVDKLKSITHLVTHANCPDGIASALIVKDALPDARVTFVYHGDAVHRGLEPAPGMLFCDITPYVGDTSKHPLNREDGSLLDCWVRAGAVVLDHHPTARDVVEAFGENGVFGLNEESQCGAWLAYEQVWKPLLTENARRFRDPDKRSSGVEEFARFAAIRDTWKRASPDWQRACEQAAELLFWRLEDMELNFGLGGGSLGSRRTVDERLFEKQLEASRRSVEESHHFTTEKGTRVLMFQGVSTTSDAAELVEKDYQGTAIFEFEEKGRQPDLVVGFHYKVDGGVLKLQFSTRSHTGYDVGAFCKSHPGGGGHKAAAGFTVTVSPELSANPYQTFRLLLEQWEGAK